MLSQVALCLYVLAMLVVELADCLCDCKEQMADAFDEVSCLYRDVEASGMMQLIRLRQQELRSTVMPSLRKNLGPCPVAYADL